MRNSNPPTQRSRRSASIRVLRFTAIAFVDLAAVALAVLQTSGAKNRTQNSPGGRTYQPTAIPITRFEPLNFAAASAAEQLSAATEDKENELEEVDEPGALIISELRLRGPQGVRDESCRAVLPSRLR